MGEREMMMTNKSRKGKGEGVKKKSGRGGMIVRKDKKEEGMKEKRKRKREGNEERKDKEREKKLSGKKNIEKSKEGFMPCEIIGLHDVYTGEECRSIGTRDGKGEVEEEIDQE
jgi:hypothetical protein